MNEASFTEISYERRGPVAVVALDRPGRRNAGTPTMARELLAALDRTDADDDVRAVVLTGRGDTFCAGADLAAGADTFAAGDETYDHARHADVGGLVTLRIFRSRKPVIAAVNGDAVGFGATVTLPADVRLCTPTARFGFVFSRLGLVLESCSSWFLPRVVGMGVAADWAYTGRLVPAPEAQAAGLVHATHAADELLDAAVALGVSLAAGTSAVSVAMNRALMWRMLGESSPVAAHEIESRAIVELGRSADVREGIAAFFGKRPAEFPMRVSTDLPEFFVRYENSRDVATFLAAERP